MENTDIGLLHKAFLASSGVFTDSRKVKPGQMFFALKGERFDGNVFAPSVLENGASCAVISADSVLAQSLRDGSRQELRDRCFIVEDTLTALQELARYHRSRFNIPVIALTGTNGKTTTKELLCAVLSRKYNVTATVGNLNNHIGVPLTLLNISGDTEIAVIEMGANHPGEIRLLTDIAQPDYGLVTNVGKAHLLGFGSFEGVMKAKGELYDHLQQKGAPVFLNADNPDLCAMVGSRPGLKAVKYGMNFQKVSLLAVTDEDPFLRMVIPICLEADSGEPCLEGDPEYMTLNTHLVGAYNADNVLAALNAGLYFGVSLREALTAVTSYVPSNNRSQLADTGKNLLVLDTYNANPSSMKVSLENFASSRFRNKMLILGDMLELGEDSLQEHVRVIDQVEKMDFIRCYLVGSEFAAACDRCRPDARIICVPDVEELNHILASERYEHHSFLVKGSNGINLPAVREVL